MFDLFGKTSFILVLIGLLSTGIARCSIDLENGAKFMRGVGSSMLGTDNPELTGTCENGVCINQQNTDRNPYRNQPVQPIQPNRN
jgi:hypothetical protein